MPGLAGILSFNPYDEFEIEFKTMSSVLLTSNAPTKFLLNDPTLPLNVSLNSHPESTESNQTFWSNDNRLLLVYTGEPYYPNSSKLSHQNEGITEYFIRDYQKKGISSLTELEGSFSGLLYDKKARTLTLFNDKFGHRRIYYNISKEGRLYFSSTLKSLLKANPSLKEPNLDAIAESLTLSCPLNNKTLFSNIEAIPPASAWTFKQGVLPIKRQYFSFETFENTEQLTSTEYKSNLVECLQANTKRAFDPSNSTAISLTGGIDSRLILASSNTPDYPRLSYTYNGPYRKSFDLQIASSLSNICGINHHVINIEEGFFKKFPELSQQSVFNSDGLMDVTGSVEIYASRIARQISRIRITGNYGTEILRSYVAFKPITLDPLLFDDAISNRFKNAISNYASARTSHPLTFIASKQIPWYHTARFSVEDGELLNRSPYLDSRLIKIAHQGPKGYSTTSEEILRIIDSLKPELSHAQTDRAYKSSGHPIPRIGRRLIQEASAKLEYYFDYGMPKTLSIVNSSLFPKKLEQLFLGRHKFYHFRSWYRDYWHEYINETILESYTSSCPWINKKRARAVLEKHHNGSQNFTLEITKMLTLALFYKQFLK